MRKQLSIHTATIVLTLMGACADHRAEPTIFPELSVTKGAMESTLFRFPVDVEGDASAKIKEGFEAFATTSPNLYQTGLSLDTGCGKPVFAPASGKVALVFKDHETLGNGLVIGHPLDSGTTAFSTLAHLAKVMVTEGTPVGPNTQVGISGKTGNVSSCRLHMRVGATADIVPEYIEYVPSTVGYADPAEFMFGLPSTNFDICSLQVTSLTPLLVDDWSPCFARGGAPTLWTESLEGVDQHGWLSTVSPEAPPFGEWTYSVKFTGSYTISAHVGPMGANYPQAHYTVQHDGGETEVLINQQANVGQYVILDQVQLTAGKTYKVRLDATDDIDGTALGFDAIKVQLDCAFEDTTTCVGNQVFWKDSCGNIGNFVQDCNDNNVCTTDHCAAGVCQYKPESGTPCDDGSECTKNETCLSGKCAGGTDTCDDNNPCTADFCYFNKCNYAFASGSCDDGNICTEGEFCANGTCLGGTLWSCDDDNPCTLDICDPESGECTFVPIPANCEDRECGMDVCGNSCGECADGNACSPQGQCIDPCAGRPGPRCIGDHLYLCDNGPDQFIDCGNAGGFCGIDRNGSAECQLPPRQGVPMSTVAHGPTTKSTVYDADYLWPNSDKDTETTGCSSTARDHAHLGNVLLLLGLGYLVWMRRIVRPTPNKTKHEPFE